MPAATTTSTTLLQELRNPENHEAWRQVVDRDRPLVVRFGLRAGLGPEDAEDAAQETLASFARAFREGRYDRDKGRLRSWLFGIARNQVLKARDRLKDREVQLHASGSGTGPLDRIQAPDPSEELWDQEWRAAVLRQCMEEVRREVRPQTLRAFEKTALKDRPPEDVARELGTSVNAVRLAKCRVLARIRDILPLIEGML
jgi:RNA polymerase sigma-70 factor (ECF subfamily)